VPIELQKKNPADKVPPKSPEELKEMIRAQASRPPTHDVTKPDIQDMLDAAVSPIKSVLDEHTKLMSRKSAAANNAEVDRISDSIEHLAKKIDSMLELMNNMLEEKNAKAQSTPKPTDGTKRPRGRPRKTPLPTETAPSPDISPGGEEPAPTPQDEQETAAEEMEERLLHATAPDVTAKETDTVELVKGYFYENIGDIITVAEVAAFLQAADFGVDVDVTRSWLKENNFKVDYRDIVSL
jgi:hypothetical protein